MAYAAAGVAALSMAESLLLTLIEKGLLDAADVAEALEVCVDMHRTAAFENGDRHINLEAAQLIDRLLVGQNLESPVPGTKRSTRAG